MDKKDLDPSEEVKRLRGAIIAHRASVLSDQVSTDDADKELWSVLD